MPAAELDQHIIHRAPQSAQHAGPISLQRALRRADCHPNAATVAAYIPASISTIDQPAKPGTDGRFHDAPRGHRPSTAPTKMRSQNKSTTRTTRKVTAEEFRKGDRVRLRTDSSSEGVVIAAWHPKKQKGRPWPEAGPRVNSSCAQVCVRFPCGGNWYDAHNVELVCRQGQHSNAHSLRLYVGPVWERAGVHAKAMLQKDIEEGADTHSKGCWISTSPRRLPTAPSMTENPRLQSAIDARKQSRPRDEDKVSAGSQPCLISDLVARKSKSTGCASFEGKFRPLSS